MGSVKYAGAGLGATALRLELEREGCQGKVLKAEHYSMLLRRFCDVFPKSVNNAILTWKSTSG